MSREDYTSPFPMTFTGENTLVVRSGNHGDWSQILKEEIKQLDAKGKTVIITDSHIFLPDDSATYKEDLVEVLKSLNAKEIIFTSYKGFGQKIIRNYVEAELKKVGVIVKMKSTEIHDRYWVCKENGKVVSANSPNGIGKRTSSITLESENDAKIILQDLTDKKVFEDEK